MSKPTQNKINIFPTASLTVLGLLFLVVALILVNFQYLKDSYVIFSTPTSAETLALVQDAGMNDKGQFYFRASTPQLKDATEFNQACRNDREQSDAILGCYANQKIYVYDIKDERLNGVREVTAAHEGLHAIYDRLSVGDKNYVNKLLDAEYQTMKDDPEAKERMDYYNKTEPGQFYNELHSIVATEKKDISRSLEDYYSQYFSDRSKSVNLHLTYSLTIKELSDKARRLNDELVNQKTQLEASIAKYNSDAQGLNSSITIFNQNASTEGYFKSQADFSNARQQLSRRAKALDQQYDIIEADIKRHEDLIKEYNGVAIEVNEVNRNLNSTLAPKPSL